MTKSFEEFEVYQKGILLAKLIFKLLENKSFEKEFSFKDQSFQLRIILQKVLNTIITSN